MVHITESEIRILKTLLKGVFSEEGKLYQLWAEPPTIYLPEVIRNDYNDELNARPTQILAFGEIKTVMRVHTAWNLIMEDQAKSDGFTATQVPPPT